MEINPQSIILINVIKVKVGDSFEEGDVLCEVETDKAVVAFEAVGVEAGINTSISTENSLRISTLI